MRKIFSVFAKNVDNFCKFFWAATTNIILDLIFKRDGYDVAVDLFKVISKHRHTGYITASSVTDLFYIIHKNLHNNEKTYQSMDYIFKLVSVLGVMPDDIKDAFESKWKDFEDCVQYTTAKNNDIDYIVTVNIKDYEKEGSDFVITPEECIELLKQ